MAQTLRRTLEVIQHGIADGLHLGAQIYVSLRGKTIFNDGVGHARPGVPMRSDTVNYWRSSGKPITAVAIARLWERGKLALDNRVTQYIPEFGANGKASITIRHILTHTGGFRGFGMRWDRPVDEMLADIYSMSVENDWKIGKTAGYHSASSWFILAEIIHRVEGRAFGRYVREEIFLPLGMHDSWIGMSSEAYRTYVEQDRIATTYDTQQGSSDPSRSMPTEQACGAVNPGGNYRAPARELGRFYEALGRILSASSGTPGEGRGEGFLQAHIVEALVARHRSGLFDLTFQHKIDFGLGFIVDSNIYGADTVPYGYGLHASRRTFGHSGAESSCAFCDPEIGLVVAWVCNGFPGESKHQNRQRAINTAIYEDFR